MSDVLRTAGFIPIPLTGKKPIPKGWSEFWKCPPSAKAYETWRNKNSDANVGLSLGEVIAIDIDHDEKAAADGAQELVFKTIGETTFVRVGREPRRTCFYRINLHAALDVGSWKVGNVELLAAGKQSVIFGNHPDTGKAYVWPHNSLINAKKSDLPLVHPAGLDAIRSALHVFSEGRLQECNPSARLAEYKPSVGERNNTLFKLACELAWEAASETELTTLLQARNITFDAPLPEGEVESISASAFRYKVNGTLIRRGKEALIVLPITRTVAAGVVQKLTLYASRLYLMLVMTRPNHDEFSIPQKATGQYLGFSTQKVSDAIKELKERGLLIDEGRTKGGSRNLRATKMYRFGSGSL